MTGSPIGQAAIVERRRKVAVLYLEGTPKGQIAEVRQVSPDTPTLDLRWLEDEWSKELIDDPVRLKAVELARLNMLGQKAYEKFDGTGDGRWMGRILKAEPELTGKDRTPLAGTISDAVRLAAGDDDESR